MRKVLLLIDCDACGRLYDFSRTASEDITAWHVHGNIIIQMALDDGWHQSYDTNYHYCPRCLTASPDLHIL